MAWCLHGIVDVRAFLWVTGLSACNGIAGLEDLQFDSQRVEENTSSESSTSQSTQTAGGTGSSQTGGGTASEGGGGDGVASSSGQGGSTGACASSLGPAMVDMGGWCIDETEVTNAQYAAWLATSPTLTSQPLYCSWNASFVPLGGPPSQSYPNHPVTFVDWCDAHAFCAAAGKRLCGQISGGPDVYEDVDDAAGSQWYIACSHAGATSYAWGNGYQAGICVGAGYDNMPFYQPGSDAAVPVKEAAGCRGTHPPYNAIWDLSGNVAEWVDACEGYSMAGAEERCHRRGGSFTGEANPLKCADDSHSTREVATAQIGFRCCSP